MTETDIVLQRSKLSAKSAGLRQSDTEGPGWRRIKCGSGWRYVDNQGTCIKGEERERCRSLVIPPAWTDVWICPNSDGHILAMGYDAAGRRQYIYHPVWTEVTSAAKFDDLPLFAARLPALRRRVAEKLKSPVDEREYALALIISLMDSAGLRVGHRRYRKLSGAVGVTTLQSRHVKAAPEGVYLRFPGKSGRLQNIHIDDPDIGEALQSLCGKPTEDLFDLEEGRIRAADVNAFVAEEVGAGFTAKDFRTWGGSVAATRALLSAPAASVTAVVKAASDWLGNTPAVARSAYIHPSILAAAEAAEETFARQGPARLRAAERACLGLINTYGRAG